MGEQVFTVEGMTCSHCVDAVTREVAAVAGVESVSVDLVSKSLTCVGTADVDSIATAVAEAGYTLAR